MKQSFKGVLLVLFSAFGFGLIPVFGIYAYRGGINVSTLLFIRFVLATVFFLAYLFAKGIRINLKARDLYRLFFLGGVCYTLHSTCYLTSVRYISPSLASLLLYTYPIIVVLLSRIFEREKLTRPVAMSIIISFAGVLLIVGTSYGRVDPRGVGLVLITSLVYATYILLVNRFIKTIPPLIASTFVSLFAGFGVFGLSLLTEKLNFTFSATVWLPIFGLIIFSTLLAILTFYQGIELLGPTRASIVSMTEPLFTTISAVILFQERLTLNQALGGASVIAGAVLIALARQSRPEPEKGNAA